MSLSRTLHFSFLSVACLLAACGGISDPNQPSSGTKVRAGTVTGALKGSAPSNARVAVVWKKADSGFALGADSPVVQGKFTLDVTVPAEECFFDPGRDISVVTDTAPPSVSGNEPAAPSTTGGGPTGTAPSGLRPLTNVSGSVSEKLSVAVAGFVVYADTNNNGKLDLEAPNASSTDEILGGNRDLMLTYLRNGTGLDLEKLRDKSGIAPIRGLNLLWDEKRWVGLDVAELELDADARLPSGVCASTTSSVQEDTDNGSSGEPRELGPDDVVCSPDGRSYTYKENATCGSTTPVDAGAPGLCSTGIDYTDACPPMAGVVLPVDGGVPPNWPCPVEVDGGAAPIDAGAPSTDGSVPTQDASAEAGAPDAD